MKKTLPLFFGCAVGLWFVIAAFVPHHAVYDFTQTDLTGWASVIAACAYIAGGLNLIQVTWPKIRRREADWPYKVVLLASALIMFAAGLPWGTAKDPSTFTTVSSDATLAGRNKAVIEIVAPGDIKVVVAGVVTHALDEHGKPSRIEVDPGVIEASAQHGAGGFATWNGTLNLKAGDVARLATDPPMMWGKDGRVRTWMYDHLFAPCNATMFSLLAFFVASAAFRAFRARNVESGLLLGSAIIVLLGRAPMGAAISTKLPALSQWILDIPNNGSRRAIIMGAAVGAIATGLRVILGLERSHLGGDS
ncbi:MAG TPA: hypothetical protein PLF40_06525 [Kofleriaceae bacterium]|nr:hypothetical protein [Kofleriaceae bacterium]